MVSATREAPPGGWWAEVAPERMARWVESFRDDHGAVTATAGPESVTLAAEDGAVAECHPPFPPVALARAGTDPAALAARMAEHGVADRTVGVLLVRLGGYSAGVFTGAPPRLAASKTGSRLVHRRSAAGGWSQRRFARRRDNQATAALRAAADAASATFGPYRDRLDAVVLGGDRRACARVRQDPRLRPFLDLAVERFLTVPDPRLAVLRDSPRHFRAIRVHLTGPV